MSLDPFRVEILSTRAGVLRFPHEASAVIIAESNEVDVIAGLDASDFTFQNCLRFPIQAAALIAAL